MTCSQIQYGQLPALLLQSADGARATLSLYGGHLLSWQSADGREHLFMSRASSLDGQRAIRGGVPLIFPQFAAFGPGPRHGYARTSTWRAGAAGQDDAGRAFCELHLEHGSLPPALAAAWPCALTLRVSLRGQELEMVFQVENQGQVELNFAAALHTYFALHDIAGFQLHGLQGVDYTENACSPPLQGQQQEAALQVSGKLDRIYRKLPRALCLQQNLEQGQMHLHWQQSGFCDAVVWNPWQEDAAALADMGDEEYRRFICVEAACLQGTALAPGATWCGTHNWRAEFIPG